MLESNRTEGTRLTDTLSQTQLSIDRALREARIGLWVWEMQSNNVYFSPEWKRQLGYQDHELRSRFGEFEERLHPQDRNSTLAALKAYVEGRRPDYEVEFRLRHKDGTYRWIFSHAFLQTGADGKPCRVSGCHLDITDRKEAEKERARLLAGEQTSPLEADTAQQQLSNILESISDGFVALDKTWRYTYVNRQAASLFGRSPQDLIGKHIWTEFPEGVGQPFHLAYEKAMAKRIFIQMENYYEPWDRWFENRIYPSSNGISIFFHEITERKQAEQVARENAELLKGQNEVLELIAQGTPLPKTLDFLLRFIEAQCPGMLGSILLLDADGVHVRHGAAPSLPASYTEAIDGQRIGPSAGSCGTAAFRREPVIVEDIATDSLWDDYRDFALRHDLHACWSIPIFDEQHHVLGTFALYFRTPGRPTGRHWQLIETTTQTAAFAIVKQRETEARRAGEERLRLAVTGGNVGIWEWDVRNNRLVWSDQLYAMFGWPQRAEDLTLKTFLDSVHHEDRLRIETALDRSLAERSNCEVEYRILQPNGSVRWIAAKGLGEYDANGTAVRMVGVALDITDRKGAEEEINRREAQLAEAQRIAQLGSYEWDVQNNTVYRSEELCSIFGLLPSEFKPTFEAYLERVHPEDRSATKETIEQAFRECKPFEFEERIVRADGAIRVLHSQGKWIKSLDSLKLLGICQDITERKQAEDLLRRSEERFQIVARATSDAIWDWDLVTNAMWWNQSLTALFRYSPDEVGSDASWKPAHIHPEDLENVVSGLRDVMNKGEQFWSGEYRFRRADDSYADIFDRGFVIYDSAGKPSRMLGAMADISERKRALEMLEQRVATRTAELQEKNRELEHEISQRKRVEELLRARNEELKAFAYTVSHDLKAPLRGIDGYARELDRRHRQNLGDRALFCLKQILTAAHNLDHLIEDLLHYSRLDAETPTRTDINLAHVVEGILRDRKRVIIEHNAEVTVSLSSTSLHTWERGLHQVLTNLVDNALKYSQDAKASRIHISSQELADAVRIMISDNGIGFDMKYHDRIFGLFNRLVRQEEFEGTGAGLAIAKKVVEKLGGKIWAESKPGLGAKFFVEIPKKDPSGSGE